jgi:hypothetical protein
VSGIWKIRPGLVHSLYKLGGIDLATGLMISSWLEVRAGGNTLVGLRKENWGQNWDLGSKF